MADEITDLTEDEEESGGNGKGKSKNVKAPKAPKAPKEKGAKKEKAEKGEKKKAGKIILIAVLVLVLLIGMFVAAVILDIFGARGMVNDVLGEPILAFAVWLDPEFTTVSGEMRRITDERVAELTAREERLIAREDEVAGREEAANSREQQLDRRETALDTREAELNLIEGSVIPIHRRAMSEEELADMMSLSRTYAQMAPDVAAVILVELHDPMDVAALLYYMGERNAAAILSVLEPDFAAELTEILLYS